MELTEVAAELSAYYQGAQDALRALAESFEKQGMTVPAQITRRALAAVTSTRHSKCFERCGSECLAPVFDDEEFYDGHADHNGEDDL